MTKKKRMYLREKVNGTEESKSDMRIGSLILDRSLVLDYTKGEINGDLFCLSRNRILVLEVPRICLTPPFKTAKKRLQF